MKQLRVGLVGIEQEILSASVESQSNGTFRAHTSNRVDALKAQYKDQLPADPSFLIGQEKITCAVCGEKYARLTSTHIEKHGLSVEEYKKVFGYSKKDKLSALDQQVWHGNKEKPVTPLPDDQPSAETSTQGDNAHAGKDKASPKLNQKQRKKSTS